MIIHGFAIMITRMLFAYSDILIGPFRLELRTYQSLIAILLSFNRIYGSLVLVHCGTLRVMLRNANQSSYFHAVRFSSPPRVFTSTPTLRNTLVGFGELGSITGCTGMVYFRSKSSNMLLRCFMNAVLRVQRPPQSCQFGRSEAGIRTLCLEKV